ncbi:hypothetical protein HanRHA438_Chr02g0066361 [Helianthus annuus]|nr:hypothetical protein HanRHA438_Chr02g0066361 [Helianthus annuus]
MGTQVIKLFAFGLNLLKPIKHRDSKSNLPKRFSFYIKKFTLKRFLRFTLKKFTSYPLHLTQKRFWGLRKFTFNNLSNFLVLRFTINVLHEAFYILS